MNRLSDLPFFDDDMPVAGAFGCPTSDGQLIPDSMSGFRYMQLRDLAARKKVSKDFDAILLDVKMGKFSSVKQFALAQGKHTTWANELRKVAIAQGLVTAAEWKACFKRKERSQ